jgi:hypothetical protein
MEPIERTQTTQQFIAKIEATIGHSDKLNISQEREKISIAKQKQFGNLEARLNIDPPPLSTLTCTESVITQSLKEREKMVELQRNQLKLLQIKIQKDLDSMPDCLNASQLKKNTFFICETDSDYDSDCTSHYDSDEEEEYEMAPSPLFEKANLNHSNKRPSLLSVALQRNDFRKVQSEVNVPSRQTKAPVVQELSASLRQNLQWEHHLGFNTTRSNNYTQELLPFNLDYW